MGDLHFGPPSVKVDTQFLQEKLTNHKKVSSEKTAKKGPFGKKVGSEASSEYSHFGSICDFTKVKPR